MDYDNMTREQLITKLSDHEYRLEGLRKGMKAVRDLIDSSEGVTGLSLDNYVTPWGDLLLQGCSEEWLGDFCNAYDYFMPIGE
jgi:hypothetical protein